MAWAATISNRTADLLTESQLIAVEADLFDSNSRLFAVDEFDGVTCNGDGDIPRTVASFRTMPSTAPQPAVAAWLSRLSGTE